MRILVQIDWRFWFEPIGHSSLSRSMIPAQSMSDSGVDRSIKVYFLYNMNVLTLDNGIAKNARNVPARSD